MSADEFAVLVRDYMNANTPLVYTEEQLDQVERLVTDLYNEEELSFADALIRNVKSEADVELTDEQWEVFSDAVREHW